MAVSKIENPMSVDESTCMQIAQGSVETNAVYKTGNIAFISYEVSGATIAGWDGTVCQLREGYRPTRTQMIGVLVNYAGTLNVQRLKVSPDGTIKTLIGSNTATAVYIRGIPILLN